MGVNRFVYIGVRSLQPSDHLNGGRDMSGKRHAIAIVLFLLLSQIVMKISHEAQGGNYSIGGGSGTASDPYLIEDVWDLQNMSLNSHYALKNDIDATITKNWNFGAGFSPVGNNSNRFNG